MAIFIDARTHPMIQGITGRTGRNIVDRLHDEGSPIVAGVTRGRGGTLVQGVPVFGSCAEAVTHSGVDASFVCVPPPAAFDAVVEAIEAGIRTIVVYTEGVPTRDAIAMVAMAQRRGIRLIGPNAAGCVSPGQCNLSDLNAANLVPGRIGIVSKSGTLACEAADDLIRHGHGQSTIVCIGGDPVLGTYHREALEHFEADDATDAVVMIGEIGGRSELEAAACIHQMTKPVIAHVAGRAAPAGKRMGHAGALLSQDEETAARKLEVLHAHGARVTWDFTQIGKEVAASVPAADSVGGHLDDVADRGGAAP